MKRTEFLPIALFSGLLLSSAGRAQDGENNASHLAFRAYFQCLVQAAGKIDNESANIADVAKAIAPLCDLKMEEAVEASAKDLTPEYATRFRQMITENREGYATGAVLKHRRDVKEGKQ